MISLGDNKNLSEYLPPNLSTTFYDNIQDILGEINFSKKSKKCSYAEVASVFDIEATSFVNMGIKQCTMYAWVFGFNGRCVRGRNWWDFFKVLDTVKRKYRLSLEKRLIIWVHNLSYEFQWFKNYFEWDKVFAIDARKPLYAITKDGIEFRCSYLLSGYSLEILGDNLTKYKVSKKVGDLDYNLIRHSMTPLTDNEWGYILNDGLVVMAHIQEEIERLGSIKKLPLTKTGYVRELCKEKCLKGENKYTFNALMKNLKLTPDQYKQLKRTYMGGFTHANINYVDKIIHRVKSFDFSSSYPSVMIAEYYPMSSPILVEIKDENDFKEHLKKYCCMFDCKFHNIRSKVSFENYISYSRCSSAEHYVLNNGRIVEADTIEISLTEQDFFIINRMYEWDTMEISNFHKFYRGYLPRDFILTILELYKDKTELKGVEGKEVEYLVSKGMINACYGMCVTDICRNEIVYENNEWSTKQADIDTLIEKYNKNRQRFLYYAWGVWVTAYARRNLFTGILEFGDDYIYSDTDSIKVINVERHKDYIEKYNKRVTEKINKCLEYYDIPKEMAFPKTIKGVVKPLGVWDYEGEYSRFKTLGAKRYMTEMNGEISITIAGVGKKAGIAYLKYKYKTNDEIFNNFTENLYFPPHYDNNGIDENGSGKLCHTYIDGDMYGTVTDYLGHNFTYCEQSGVHMENTDYTLSLDAAFVNLLLGVKLSHIL